ncbi:MAG: hypothetical protein HY002_00420 [Candidatus Rokubacteria bacterium]|nr:hypothetical protein [Candidatus Rokubacteria bacterium]
MNDMGFDLIAHLDRDVLPALCSRRKFSLIDPVADRHGSWEWTFHKRADELDRFVSVALTSLPRDAAATEPSYAVEVWAGAEKVDRYTRHLVSDFRAGGAEQSSYGIRRTLDETLARAMTLAESLKPADLTEAYLPSRQPR